jgi:hypothetical protein
LLLPPEFDLGMGLAFSPMRLAQGLFTNFELRILYF